MNTNALAAAAELARATNAANGLLMLTRFARIALPIMFLALVVGRTVFWLIDKYIISEDTAV